MKTFKLFLLGLLAMATWSCSGSASLSSQNSSDINEPTDSLHARTSLQEAVEKRARSLGFSSEEDFKPGFYLKKGSYKPPLYIINGRTLSRGSLLRLAPDSIANITVLKDSAAIARYGKKGTNGIISIKTKPNH